jgi:phage/plasmid-like protein (TIGR03299 family)
MTIDLQAQSLTRRSGVTLSNVDLSDPRILHCAGLDWQVNLTDLRTDAGVSVPEHKAVVRSDTQAVLGVVGSQWTGIQNSEMLDTLRSLAGQIEGSKIETAGMFGGGKRVWLQCTAPSMDFNLGDGDGDQTLGKLLITSRHDGTGAMRLCPTGVRVICQNTLAMALKQGRNSNHNMSIRHTPAAPDRLKIVCEAYGRAMIAWNKQREALKALAEVKASKASFEAMMLAAWGLPGEDEGERAKDCRTEREATIRRIEQGERGTTTKATEGSLYNQHQAVVEYIDHILAKHDTGIESALWGDNHRRKSNALEAALSFA